MAPLAESGTGLSSLWSPNKAVSMVRSGGSRLPASTQASTTSSGPMGQQYHPPAWELTSNYNRKFEEVVPPYVRFDRPPATPLGARLGASERAMAREAGERAGVLSAADTQPVFPWIEATVERQEGDPWGRDAYNGVGTSVDPSSPIAHTHPLPWRPVSPSRLSLRQIHDVPDHMSAKALPLRVRTQLTFKAKTVAVELEVAAAALSPTRKQSALSPHRLARSRASVVPIDGFVK